MILRSLRLTDSEFWKEELGKLTQMLLGNEYPEKAIQRNIRMVMDRWKEETMKERQDEQKKNYPYVYPPVNWLGSYSQY
ncbi:unnamed protein product [Protopolystoma xenopodis]|uniref:Helix-turn-helix domain-containing protein n=1 Tax=Protopolystoma xenopodis TaxID=117903 RepID=A0A3S5AS60_9PLAT|nr:unnamed protein product [Protopolystoma xenopodis]